MTRRGDSHWYVGHTHGQRLTLFYVEVRANDDGELVAVWQFAAEPVRHVPSHETAPPTSRRVGGLPQHQRPGVSSEGRPGGSPSPSRA